MGTTIALLPSPLLGGGVWAPVAERLRSSGWTVAVPRLEGPVRSPEDVLAGFVAQLPVDGDLVLVPHSNSGLYVAALAAARTVTGIVFVDAGLPSAEPVTPTAPASVRERLGRLEQEEGLLPPWTAWWPESDLGALFPDDTSRADVEREEPRLPLSYFDADVPTPAGWESTRAAYLAFGEAYAPEKVEAGRRGWPVLTLPGEHLHMLVDPADVATAVEDLLGVIGITRTPRRAVG